MTTYRTHTADRTMDRLAAAELEELITPENRGTPARLAEHQTIDRLATELEAGTKYMLVWFAVVFGLGLACGLWLG